MTEQTSNNNNNNKSYKRQSNFDCKEVIEFLKLFDINSWEELNNGKTIKDIDDYPKLLEDFNNNYFYFRLNKMLLIKDFPKLKKIENFKKNEDVLSLLKMILKKRNFTITHYTNAKHSPIIRIEPQK